MIRSKDAKPGSRYRSDGHRHVILAQQRSVAGSPRTVGSHLAGPSSGVDAWSTVTPSSGRQNADRAASEERMDGYRIVDSKRQCP
jgi:hypothetical protein